MSRRTFNEDRYLLVDDTDEDASEILTVICDGNPRTGRRFDYDAYANAYAYGQGGVA